MMKFVFFSFNQIEDYWEERFPGLISERKYISPDDGEEYILYMIQFDYLDQYQQFIDEILRMRYNIKIYPTESWNDTLRVAGEGAPLMYINDTVDDIEVM